MSHKSIQAIVTDIEGTTSSISFVHEVLFPYSEKNLQSFLENNLHTEDVQNILVQVRELMNAHGPRHPAPFDYAQGKLRRGISPGDLSEIIAILKKWIADDQKITPLKELQGLIWEEGFKRGDFKGHLYEDAFDRLKKWKGQGLRLFVYSSGSEKAQRLLFRYNEYGDLSSFFENHFDTRIGAKKEAQSYNKIAESLKLPVESILFLSDVEAELDAAKAAGMQTVGLIRYRQGRLGAHVCVESFAEL